MCCTSSLVCGNKTKLGGYFLNQCNAAAWPAMFLHLSVWLYFANTTQRNVDAKYQPPTTLATAPSYNSERAAAAAAVVSIHCIHPLLVVRPLKLAQFEGGHRWVGRMAF